MQNLKVVWRSAHRELPPVPPDGSALVVGVRIALVKFKALDEVAGTVDLVLDFVLCWSDNRLTFDADKVFHHDWSHMEDRLTVPSGSVWTPDVVVLNQVSDMDAMFRPDNAPVSIADSVFQERTGANMMWTRRINVHAGCNADMSQFPFDRQRCAIKIGSWASSRRQMVLVPQQQQENPDLDGSVRASHFSVRNITVEQREVYMRNAAERFSELLYIIELERYPHYWVLNFMLPMIAVTMLTIATMWMTQAGIRANSATRMLLCVVQIINITASWRPANKTDIWLDRFQTHCLALAMAAVLQSLIIDYLLKTALFEISWMPRSHVVETQLRTVICVVAICVFIMDLTELTKRDDMSGLYNSFTGHSSKLIVGFVYIIFTCLGASSVLSTLWLVLPTKTFQRLCSNECTPFASGKASEGHRDSTHSAG